MEQAHQRINYWKESTAYHNGIKNILVFNILILFLLMSCGDQKNSNHNSDSDTITGILIGDQVWAKTNLDVSTFRNGDSIPEIRSKEEWERAGKEGRPAWCYYENDAEKGKTYGRMYNWYALTDPRGLCPEGWHFPTNEEWIALENYLGVSEAGIKLKCEKGWNANGNGDNSSKLCVLPGGYRGRDGGFSGAGEFIYLSSVSEEKFEDSKENKMVIWGRGIQFESHGVMRCLLDKEFGLYVRCIKDKS
jgi:uncharacterized protein (TIGR02145 family)